MVFPVVIYGCESWTIKKAECWRTDAFELWFWRRLLRVPCSARRSNQSILKEISPEYSLEGLMLKLKLQCFGRLTWRANLLERVWCWERLKAKGEGEIEDERLDSITDSVVINLSRLWKIVKDRGTWRAVVHGVPRVGHNLATEQQQQEWHLINNSLS